MILKLKYISVIELYIFNDIKYYIVQLKNVWFPKI